MLASNWGANATPKAQKQGWMVPGLDEKKKETETFCFLTIAGDVELGWVGGSLLLDRRGRPLEFHCTAPVRPNRAQVILYGRTLRPYVVGDQIALALMKKTKSTPGILWTDDADVLGVRESMSVPIGYVNGESAGKLSIDVGNGLAAVVHKNHPHDAALIRQRWDADGGSIELEEPFDRIREAIAEALKVNSKSAA
jgi:hypothetical protein